MLFIISAVFALITYIGGQERLYCTHEALTIAYDNPTAFCQLSGMYKNIASCNITAYYHKESWFVRNPVVRTNRPVSFYA